MAIRVRVLQPLIRLLLAAVFIYGGVSKLRPGEKDQPTVFGRSPHWVQTVLPVVECALGAWLLIGRSCGVASLISVIFLSLFAGVIASELRNEQPMPCGCTGATVFVNPSEIRHALEKELVVDVGLTFVALYLFHILWSGSRGSTSDQFDRKPGFTGPAFTPPD